jgi:phosphoribosylanthranilate isomerase
MRLVQRSPRWPLAALQAPVIVKALRAMIRDAPSRRAATPPKPLPALLVDAFHPDLYGGTGQPGDWELARRLAAHYPLLLAGGLHPGNVAQAALCVRPWGVDVASGVESAPGRKDFITMKAFIQAARNLSKEVEPC